MTLQDLLALVPPYHANQPKFMAMLEATFAPFIAASVVTQSLPSAFDLDSAIGLQLDATGAWIGRDRYVAIPIPGAYFTLDLEGLGYDQGVWKESYSGETAIYSLDDDTYRRLLRANIVAKRWDGTVPDAQLAFDTFFIDPETHVFVQDNAQVPYPVAFFALDDENRGFDTSEWYVSSNIRPSTGKVDVSMTIGVSGKIPTPIELGLLAQGAIPIKPGGVQTTYAVTSVDQTPLFGFDVQNEFVSGFDVGGLGVTPDALLAA